MIMHWTCDICKQLRPDLDISVLKKPLTLDGQVIGEMNVKYCNDNAKCIEGAKFFSHINKKENDHGNS